MPIYDVHEYNGYVSTIKDYLLHYAAFTQYIKDTEMRIQDIDWMLDETPAPRVPGLSGAGGCGGGDGTSPQEQDYLRNEHLKDEKKRLERDLKKVKGLVERLTECFHALDETDQKILKIYYIENAKSWEWTAKMINASTTFTFKHGKAALKELTIRFFGPKSMPVQTHFTFID
nr:MAG TPA: Protein of unknown function (DUF722) [Caudoviricetes sp.]